MAQQTPDEIAQLKAQVQQLQQQLQTLSKKLDEVTTAKSADAYAGRDHRRGERRIGRHHAEPGAATRTSADRQHDADDCAPAAGNAAIGFAA